MIRAKFIERPTVKNLLSKKPILSAVAAATA
jgi:hypothetical protein